ncbi:MAG: hypothetical protein B7Z66_08805 [Chromatiales bacterium 21-64-14]|nr:MAG: hypothetical protein B7Z66_08805 [Chromatiales bacterium 21-64-14]HQU16119.1 OsmC family protein [Gammaproteobacteria bacterium]
MPEDGSFTVEVEQLRDYEFRVKFDWPEVAELTLDEPPPLGARQGPNASRLLAAAVANCLSASLLFCLEKSRLAPGGIKSVVRGTLVRNADKHLRIGGLNVVIDLVGMGEAGTRLGRCVDLFEEFCVVTASVRQGIPVDVTVRADGDVVHRDPGGTGR